MAATAVNPGLGDSTPNAPPISEQFIIRPARLSDIPTLAQISTRAYWLSAVNRFIAPHAPEFPNDMPRFFRQLMWRRICLPNGLFLVACKTSDPDVPVGYGQFVRLGDDAGAKELVASKGVLLRVWMYIMTWIFWVYNKIDLFIHPAHAFDQTALNLMREWGNEDDLKHWKSHPERSNRWYANSLVIDPEYQGRGVGRMLMVEPMQRAQSERVIMGLTSSPHGEFLYRKLGFQMLADFCKRPDTERPDEKGGGIMIWYPEGYEGVRHGD